MRPTVQKRKPIGTGIALVLILLATGTSRAVAAEKAPLSIRAETEFSLLLDQLGQAMRQEKALQTSAREAAEVASRPDTEYLFYQGSFHFAEQDARLAQLKMKKTEILQKLAPLQEASGRSTRFLRGSESDLSDRGLPPYSGAPLFSFNDATRLTPDTLPFSYFAINLFRLFFVSILLLAFSFPVMAIEKGTVHLRRKGRTWIKHRYTRIKQALDGNSPGAIVRRLMRKRLPGAPPKPA